MKNRQAYPTQEEIRQLRKAAGWTQQKMADMLNTSKRVVQQWEAAVDDVKNHRYMHPAFFELAQIKAGQHQEFQKIKRNTMNTEMDEILVSKEYLEFLRSELAEQQQRLADGFEKEQEEDLFGGFFQQTEAQWVEARQARIIQLKRAIDRHPLHPLPIEPHPA